MGFRMSGKLSDDDYKMLVAELEHEMKKNGKIRLVLEFDDFHGWDVHAAWDGVKYGFKYNKYLERVAHLGDKRWQKWIAKLTKLIAKGELRYFDLKQKEHAWNWMRER